MAEVTRQHIKEAYHEYCRKILECGDNIIKEVIDGNKKVKYDLNRSFISIYRNYYPIKYMLKAIIINADEGRSRMAKRYVRLLRRHKNGVMANIYVVFPKSKRVSIHELEDRAKSIVCQSIRTMLERMR